MFFALVMLLTAITMAAVGQVLLKAGLSQLDHPSISQILLSMFRNANVFFGYAAFVLSSLVWLIALRRLPLSYAYPMVSLGYVVVVILSWRIFGETIPPLRIVALGVILTGVLLLALSESPGKSDAAGPSQPAAITHPVDGDPGAS
jgi:multidrug transporter EmrE-like cation transporter